MKKLILLFCLFVLSNKTFSQVSLGDSYEKIKKEKVDGKLMLNPKGEGYLYVHDDSSTASKFIFLLDINFVCHTTIVRPMTRKISKYWDKSLNEDSNWLRVDNKKWLTERNDGMIISCQEIKDENKQTVFVFTKIN